MGKTAMRETLKNYMKTTTLHGFKYLHSPYYVDRIGWLLCCIASACCAGVLCTVLWQHFLEMPALLTRLDNVRSDMYMEEELPAIIVCPTTESVADIILDNLSANQTEMQEIPMILKRLLSGKKITTDQVSLLDGLLLDNNITLGEVIVKYTPSCDRHVLRCRYQGATISCAQLFQPKLTVLGVCCMIEREKLENISQPSVFATQSTHILDLVLQYTYGSRIYGCQVITIYDGEDDSQPDILLPGYYYVAHQRFRVIQENLAVDKLVGSSCVSNKGYSKASCMFTCAEISCGCRDPLHQANGFDETRNLLLCSVTQMECVRGTENKNKLKCNCLPSCKDITTSMILYSSKLDVQHTIDPLYVGLNETRSIVIQFRVNVAQSRVLLLSPTDTWVTLLSSLGGVFNMFLGVGLFSALEFLFFIVFKLPAAIEKSSEEEIIAANPKFAHRQQQHYRQNRIAHLSRGFKERHDLL